MAGPVWLTSVDLPSACRWRFCFRRAPEHRKSIGRIVERGALELEPALKSV